MATKNVTTDVASGFDKLEVVVGSDPLASLTTTDKSSLVAAINEVRSDAGDLSGYVDENVAVRGVATVSNGSTTVVVAGVGTGGSHDAGVVIVSWAEDPGAATWVFGAVSSDDLTITLDQDPGKDVDVAYLVFPVVAP